MLFEAVVALHIAVWAFVLLAWTHPVAAAWNLALVVPGIYVLHAALPFHVLESAKARLHPGTWKTDAQEMERALVVPAAFSSAQRWLERRCFLSPLSPQGMLVLGALTSAWALLSRCWL